MDSEKQRLRAVTDADGATILDTEAGKISTLNATGAKVWLALQRGDGLDAIVAELARETGEQTETVKRDVREFIEALKKQRLLPR
jgi:hypothetical protein